MKGCETNHHYIRLSHRYQLMKEITTGAITTVVLEIKGQIVQSN